MVPFSRNLTLKDLPNDRTLKMLIKEAMKLNEDGVAIPNLGRKAAGTKEPIPEPDYFTQAVAKNKSARATWEAFSPSCRREYLEWITGAKTEATREKRLNQTLAQLAEGKKLHWKYEKC